MQVERRCAGCPSVCQVLCHVIHSEHGSIDGGQPGWGRGADAGSRRSSSRARLVQLQPCELRCCCLCCRGKATHVCRGGRRRGPTPSSICAHPQANACRFCRQLQGCPPGPL